MSYADYTERLLAAFVRESEAVLPGATWSAGPDPNTLVYPERSPSLGELGVGFDSEEITVFFGHRGYHQHHTVDATLLPDNPDRAATLVARDVLEFVRSLLRDEVVFRWGLWVSSARKRSSPSAVGRAWRSVTPWVREAVWSRELR
jgi:hypothetical protein